MRETAAAAAGRELAITDARLTAHGERHRLLSRTGRPEREIIAAAAAERVDVIALGAGLGSDHGPGQYPLSPIARFVVDHALRDVLPLRLLDSDEADWLT